MDLVGAFRKLAAMSPMAMSKYIQSNIAREAGQSAQSVSLKELTQKGLYGKNKPGMLERVRDFVDRHNDKLFMAAIAAPMISDSLSGPAMAAWLGPMAMRSLNIGKASPATLMARKRMERDVLRQRGQELEIPELSSLPTSALMSRQELKAPLGPD